MNDASADPTRVSRRRFIKATATAAAGLSAPLMTTSNFAYAAGSDRIRVGVVGCGGRGTGAARDAVQAAEGVEVFAMGDLFEDRLDRSKENLKEAVGPAFDVSDARTFTGFDNYRGVLDAGVDYVILATPPGFRPLQFAAAVDAGVHVFLEKPVAVDPVGIRSVVASGERADERGLSVVAGTMYRRQPSFAETIARIHDGLIGTVVGAQAYYMIGPLWLRERKAGMSDMEWQCRNWYYFTWLSGDHIVEQFVHNLDVMRWVFQASPESALGMGGRLVRVEPQYGHIYDHFSVEYTFPGGVLLEAKCRQMTEQTASRVYDRVVGTEGVAEMYPFGGGSVVRSHDGDELFRYEGRGNNPYVQEHADLIASIRAGEPLNEARQVAESTLMAIMGRESAYTGLELSHDEVASADLSLVPDTFSFRPMPSPPVARPGHTTLERDWLASAGGR